MNDLFECAICHQVFEKGRSDEEAMKEAEELHHIKEGFEIEVVCDDCYKKMFGGNK